MPLAHQDPEMKKTPCGAEAQTDIIVRQLQHQVRETPAGPDGEAQKSGALVTSAEQMLLASAVKKCPRRQPGLEARKL